MRRIALLLVFSCLLARGTAVWPGEIGIYANPNCTGCEITFPPLAFDTLYVAILNDGDPPVYCGQPLYGGAFRIEGLPQGWVVVEARPTPAACCVYGEPFGPQGTAVEFGRDGTGSSDRCISLYTIVLAPLAAWSDIHLRVVGGSPCWGSGNCPMIFTGDQPCDPTCQCYPGGEIVANPVNDHCTVGVEPRTWSKVRALYRDR